MKSNWQIIPLGEIGTLERGKGLQKNDFTKTGTPCIHYGQIFTHYSSFTDKTMSHVSPETAKNCTTVQKGNAILAITSENVQDLCKSTVWLGNIDIVTGGHSGIFRHNQNPKYLGYYFQSEYFNHQKAKYAKGTKVIEINPEDILNRIKIKLPDLETQQKIVQVLEAWDSCIDKVEKLIKHEKDKLRWLTYKLVCNKENARTEKLCSLAKITTGKKDVNQGCDNGKYPFFTCAKEHTWSNDYSFDGEAICIAGNGEIGKSFYYNGKFEAYQRTYVLTDFIISGQYLNYVIRSLFKEMVEHQKQMSAMPYIKLETLKNFVVPVPDNQEIDKIIEILNDEDNIVSTYENILCTMDLQKQFLLNHLISGDLDVSNIKLEKGKEQK